jgi:hypothetical protein
MYEKLSKTTKKNENYETCASDLMVRLGNWCLETFFSRFCFILELKSFVEGLRLSRDGKRLIIVSRIFHFTDSRCLT